MNAGTLAVLLLSVVFALIFLLAWLVDQSVRPDIEASWRRRRAALAECSRILERLKEHDQRR